ncbi:hypothetical protein MNBD_GAMMA07-1095 [hydrothermal vent metagenome]|uniref:Uncharacterized protein n=1 Tax=hydrothermal vent metagenome TaxID=652676 RepID=A0A3B0WKF4_9ZZZZ
MSELDPRTASIFAREVYTLVENDRITTEAFLNLPEFSTNTGARQALTADVGFRIVNVPDIFGLQEMYIH